MIRTQPGYLHAGSNDARNTLTRIPPDAKDTSIAVEVTLENDPKTQYEHAGLVWYYDDDHYVAVFKERLGGKPKIQMVTEKGGKPSYEVKPFGSKTVSLRLVASGTKVVSQFRDAAKGAWQTVGESTLPVLGAPLVGITSAARGGCRCYARFRDFRILELAK